MRLITREPNAHILSSTINELWMAYLWQHRVGNVHLHATLLTTYLTAGRPVTDYFLLLSLNWEPKQHTLLHAWLVTFPAIVVPSIIRPIMSITLPNGSKCSCKGSNECKFMYIEINKKQQRKLPTYDKMLVTMWGLAKASCDRHLPSRLYPMHHSSRLYQ